MRQHDVVLKQVLDTAIRRLGTDSMSPAGLRQKLSVFESGESLRQHISSITFGKGVGENAVASAIAAIDLVHGIKAVAVKLYEVREANQYSHLRCRTWQAYCEEFLMSSPEVIDSFIKTFMALDAEEDLFGVLSADEEILDVLGNRDAGRESRTMAHADIAPGNNEHDMFSIFTTQGGNA